MPVIVDTGPLAAFFDRSERDTVMTLDSDFVIYRKRGRVPITLMHPDIAA